MTEEITALLSRIESDHGVEILYACESGSRAWGFASPNSDYDIRFLYRLPADRYLSVFEQKDTIELPICDDLDPSGWDIKKALGLLAKSNASLIEWLHSPIIYLQRDSFLVRWRELSRQVLNPHHVRNHYLGLARQIYSTKLANGSPTAKGYLYVCRALLAAHWVEDRQTAPAVEFEQLVDAYGGSRKTVISDLVAWKEEADEVAVCDAIPELDEYIHAELDDSKDRFGLNQPHPELVRVLVDEEFRRLVK